MFNSIKYKIKIPFINKKNTNNNTYLLENELKINNIDDENLYKNNIPILENMDYIDDDDYIDNSQYEIKYSEYKSSQSPKTLFNINKDNDYKTKYKTIYRFIKPHKFHYKKYNYRDYPFYKS